MSKRRRSRRRKSRVREEVGATDRGRRKYVRAGGKEGRGIEGILEECRRKDGEEGGA